MFVGSSRSLCKYKLGNVTDIYTSQNNHLAYLQMVQQQYTAQLNIKVIWNQNLQTDKTYQVLYEGERGGGGPSVLALLHVAGIEDQY